MLVLPNKSAVVWEKFLTENKVLVYKYIVREVKKNLETDNDKIDLFKFEDNTMYAWIPKNKVLQTLNEAMKIFIKEEEYEYAQKTDAVIKQYYINKVIQDSKIIQE
jgi:hypothetical protein